MTDVAVLCTGCHEVPSTRFCDADEGGLICGFPLCETCGHRRGHRHGHGPVESPAGSPIDKILTTAVGDSTKAATRVADTLRVLDDLAMDRSRFRPLRDIDARLREALTGNLTR